MPMNPHPTAFGVFRPVGHVVISFPNEAQADGAVLSLRDAGFRESDLARYTPTQMRSQAEADIGNAGAMASIGQDLNLVKAHLALARLGHSFIVVGTAKAEQVQLAADIAARWHASRAQHYGTLIVEELIPPGSTPHQTPESPDLGLDAQAPVRDDVLGPEADA